MLFRIYTEDVDRQSIIRTAAQYFANFTVLLGTGYYKGKPEQTIILEIVAEPTDVNRVHELARTLGIVNTQECVLVLSQYSQHSLVDTGNHATTAQCAEPETAVERVNRIRFADSGVSTKQSTTGFSPVAQSDESRCKSCGAPFGHYGHCVALNPNTREAQAALAAISERDEISLHGLGVKW
jgi:hypothetical protein